MFDQLKAMGALAGLLKNADRLREAGETVKRTLEETRVEAEAGAGAAKVVATGRMRVESIELSPALGAALAGDDANARAHAATMLTDAINAALERAERAARDEVARTLNELGLSDLAGMGGLGGLLGGG